MHYQVAGGLPLLLDFHTANTPRSAELVPQKNGTVTLFNSPASSVYPHLFSFVAERFSMTNHPRCFVPCVPPFASVNPSPASRSPDGNVYYIADRKQSWYSLAGTDMSCIFLLCDPRGRIPFSLLHRSCHARYLRTDFLSDNVHRQPEFHPV